SNPRPALAEVAARVGQRGLRDLHRLSLPERILALRSADPAAERLRRDRLDRRRHAAPVLGPLALRPDLRYVRQRRLCFWLEVERRGGFAAIRRILMRLRTIEASTVGELVLHHVNPVLGIDLRPIAKRSGFTDPDLPAHGPRPP